MDRLNTDISLAYTDINYINISLTPGIAGLTPNDFTLLVNDMPFIDFTLLCENTSGTLYNIIPNVAFSIYDEVYVRLESPKYLSNSLKIYISKYMYKNSAIFEYKLPQCPSGVYEFQITNLNSENFILKPSNNLIICDGINSDKSSIRHAKPLYHSSEIICVYIELIDRNNNNAPNGKYIIKAVIEKI